MESRMTITTGLVKDPIRHQFPQWAHLAVAPIEPGGWDNKTFRLGSDMLVRLPTAEAYSPQVPREHQWLPKLAPLLPLPIPEPVAMGSSSDTYPWSWSIYRWIQGETVSASGVADFHAFAGDLGRFLQALRQVNLKGPEPGPANFYRGSHTSVYDNETRRAIHILGGAIDSDIALAVWEEAQATRWSGFPVWFHGDVHPSNLLCAEGRLCAVIDFGCAGVGDPACDAAMAWTFFEGQSREVFRQALGADEGTWLRGRAWALWKVLVILADPQYHESPKARESQRVLNQILTDYRDR